MTPFTLRGLPTTVIDAGVGARSPVVVAMHGIGADEQDLIPAYRSFERQAVLAFPQGPLEQPPGHAWYRLVRVGVPDPASFHQAQQRLGDWLEALRAMEGFADRPIILSGFSQGAIMALSFALLHPDRVAGAMAFSGYIPEVVARAVQQRGADHAHQRFFLTQGKHDALFAFGRLQETATAIEALGAAPAVVAHDSGHDIPPEALAAARQWLVQTFET